MEVETTLVVDGPGRVGDLQTWSVSEAVTPFVVGDPAASGGIISAELKSSSGADDDSIFTLGREAVLTTDRNGAPDSITGKVQSVNPSGLSSVSLTIDTVLSRLNAERSAAPQWANVGEAAFTVRGSAPGQVGDVRGVSVDLTNGFVYVNSFLPGQARISKFDLDFNFVFEWAVSEGGSTITAHPDTGFVYMLDSPNMTIRKYDPDDGTLLLSADSVGSFSLVQAIPNSGGQLLVGLVAGTVPTLGIMNANLGWVDTTFMPGFRIVPVSAAIHPTTGDFYVGTQVSNAEDGSPSILVFDTNLDVVDEIQYSTLHGPVV